MWVSVCRASRVWNAYEGQRHCELGTVNNGDCGLKGRLLRTELRMMAGDGPQQLRHYTDWKSREHGRWPCLYRSLRSRKGVSSAPLRTTSSDEVGTTVGRISSARNRPRSRLSSGGVVSVVTRVMTTRAE